MPKSREQRLAKTLEALAAEKAVTAALERERLLRDRISEADAATISALRIALDAQKRENELLKKQTGRKLSIFFGLVKIRY